MLNKDIKPINAFSLTEVLVTMFIIMLVIIASAPVITKKNAKNKALHGVWECYLNESGKHESKKTIDGQGATTKVEGDYCVFEPQQNAKNYTVVAIGGGGGGASGTAFSMDAASYGSAVGYQVNAAGSYLILLVGGGGGGSAYQGGQGAKGGGAGGVSILTKTFDKNEYLVLEAGMGGTRGGGQGDTEYEGSEGPSSQICTGAAGTSWNDACKGQDGKESKLYRYVRNETYTVEGGKGAGTSEGRAGSGAIGAEKDGHGEEGGKLDYNNSQLSKFINSTDTSAVSFGFGGKGYRNRLGGQGVSGVAMLISNSHHAGDGGSRGTSAYTSLNKITDTVKVYIGKGGEGAVTEDTNGKQGENSSFGYYITAKGGEGGKARIKSTSDSTALAGEPGDISPYGGGLNGGGTSQGNLNGKNDMDVNEGMVKPTESTYGAGGGGGSSLARTGTTGSSDGRWGKGGRGMSGYVRVEWN